METQNADLPQRDLPCPLQGPPRRRVVPPRALTRSTYSHCELAVPRDGGQYDCYSSSIRDGGVRVKTMPLPPEKWDLIPIRQTNVYADTLNHYGATRGQPYDWLGAVGVITRWRDDRRKWFCSEWCAAALRLDNPARFSPEALARHFRRFQAA